MSTLNSLEALHIFSNTLRTTENMGSFLQVLSTCTKVTSLRVVTGGHIASISSDQLPYIKQLSLGHSVHFDRPPAQLQHLHLERVQHDLDIHFCMLKQLELTGLGSSLEVEAFSPAALLHLPSTLVSLTLHEIFKQDDVLDRGEVPHHDKAALHQVFERLPYLQVLSIGNYLSNFTITLFQDMRMPSVHTFGIRIHPLGTPGFSDQAGHTMVDNNNGIVRYRDGMINGNMILNGPANLQLLQQALPNVQLLKVSFMSDTDHKAALFKVGFLRQLPKLRGITCFCQNTSLTLVERDVLSTCHAAFKAPAVH